MTLQGRAVQEPPGSSDSQQTWRYKAAATRVCKCYRRTRMPRGREKCVASVNRRTYFSFNVVIQFYLLALVNNLSHIAGRGGVCVCCHGKCVCGVAIHTHARSYRQIKCSTCNNYIYGHFIPVLNHIYLINFRTTVSKSPKTHVKTVLLYFSSYLQTNLKQSSYTYFTGCRLGTRDQKSK